MALLRLSVAHGRGRPALAACRLAAAPIEGEHLTLGCRERFLVVLASCGVIAATALAADACRARRTEKLGPVAHELIDDIIEADDALIIELEVGEIDETGELGHFGRVGAF